MKQSVFGGLEKAARKIFRSKVEEHRPHKPFKSTQTSVISPVTDSKTCEDALESVSTQNVQNPESSSEPEGSFGSISTDCQASFMAGTYRLDQPKFKSSQAPMMESTAELEETLKLFARYGEGLQNARTINPIMLRQIASASSVLLRVCDEAMMERLVEQGLLKQMVDTELIRKTFDFFRLWVNLDVPPTPRTYDSEGPLIVFSP